MLLEEELLRPLRFFFAFSLRRFFSFFNFLFQLLYLLFVFPRSFLFGAVSPCHSDSKVLKLLKPSLKTTSKKNTAIKLHKLLQKCPFCTAHA